MLQQERLFLGGVGREKKKKTTHTNSGVKVESSEASTCYGGSHLPTGLQEWMKCRSYVINKSCFNLGLFFHSSLWHLAWFLRKLKSEKTGHHWIGISFIVEKLNIRYLKVNHINFNIFLCIRK